MFLKQVVDDILAERNRSLSWLAGEMGKTFDGLRLSLLKGSIKYVDIQRLAEILDISVMQLFTPPEEYAAASEFIVNEPIEGYRSNYKALKNCQEMVETLKSQIVDKEKIIELLSK
jgi:hypothetical protein